MHEREAQPAWLYLPFSFSVSKVQLIVGNVGSAKMIYRGNRPTFKNMSDLPSPYRRWRRAFFFVAAAVLIFALMPLTWPVRIQPAFGWEHQLEIGELTTDHLLAFGVTTWVAAHAWRTRLLVLVPLLLLYGVLIEVIQLAVPYRTTDFTDVVADAVGISIGLGALAATQLFKMRQLQRAKKR